MILLAVLVLAAAAIVTAMVISTWRSHRTPAELRGDWWPRFETEFRAYAGGFTRRHTHGTET
jgi:hypothetical protein